MEDVEYNDLVARAKSVINDTMDAIKNNRSDQYKKISDSLDATLEVAKQWRKKLDEETLEKTLDTILVRFDKALPTDCALGSYEPIFRQIMKEEICALTGKIKTREW
jgi:hypothetical protein